MQLKIPFGSSWELLRAAVPEWWEYSILALRAGVSACSGKARASSVGIRVSVLLGLLQPHQQAEVLIPSLEQALPSPRWAFGGRMLLRGPASCVLAFRGVSRLCSGCIGRCQEIIICAVVASRTFSPLGKALEAGLQRKGKDAEPFPATQVLQEHSAPRVFSPVCWNWLFLKYSPKPSAACPFLGSCPSWRQLPRAFPPPFTWAWQHRPQQLQKAPSPLSTHLLALLGDLLRTPLAANWWTTDLITAAGTLLGAEHPSLGHRQN